MTVNDLGYRSGCQSMPFLPTLSDAAYCEWTNLFNMYSEGELFITRALGEQRNQHPTVFFHPFLSSLKHSIFLLKKEENPESGLFSYRY